MTDIAGEALILRRAGFSPALSLLMPTFAFPFAPARLAADLLGGMECSPTNARKRAFHGFGCMLMPEYYPCGTARLVSCYALFK